MKNSPTRTVLARAAVALALCLSVCAAGFGQAGQPYDAAAKALMARPEVQAAFAHVERERERTLREWVAITEVNAPSGKERERAALVEKILRASPSVAVRYDAAGNLIATRKGAGGGPAVVLDAHLDTVFQEGLKIKPR